MKIFIVSKFGEGYGVASALADEGHEVYILLKDKKYQLRGHGIFNPRRVNDFKELKNSDVVLFDEIKMGKLAEKIKERGYNVIGSAPIADKLEDDREYGQKVMKKFTKVSLPDYKKFVSISDGIKFLETKGTDGLYCFKPFHAPTSWTFVPKQGRDNRSTISIMKAFPKEHNDFILQQKVDGIEISTEGWFNGKSFIKTFNHTFEKKRFLEGDKGPNCGCMGNVVWLTKSNKLTRTVLEPLAPFLAHFKYVGPVDINCKVDGQTAWFLEFTPRLGYDAIQAFLSLIQKKGEFLKEVSSASGEGQFSSARFAFAVRLSLSPYPYGEDHHKACAGDRGLKVIELSTDIRHHFWPWDLMMKEGELVLAGTDNIVGTVVTTGDDVTECAKHCYKTIDDISITDDLQYRRDIGVGVDRKIKKLEELGWL
jgi:phosphoribosylamine---glycine ligase